MADGQFPKILLESMKKWLKERTDQWTQNVDELGAGLTSSDPEKVMNAALTFGPGAIKAFHGSPHVFDNFNMMKMGIGQGAQTYGHGHYLAENPAVAKAYQEQLGSDAIYSRGNKIINSPVPDDPKFPSWNEAKNQAHYQRKLGESDPLMAALKDTQAQTQVFSFRDPNNVGGGGPQGRADFNQAVQRQLQAWQQQGARPATTGNFYEVEMKWPDAYRESLDPLGKQHFLDLDKSMARQSPYVRAGVDRLLEGRNHGLKPEHNTGQDVYDYLAKYSSPEAASKALEGAGIPGGVYLDGVSRGVGEGSSNFVSYSDALLKILKRRMGYE